MLPDTLTHLLALASSLEREGQYNNAKLLRAAVDSYLARLAHQLNLPTDRATLLAESDQARAVLENLGADPDLLAALDHTRATLRAGRLPAYQAVPDPYLCRTCGRLTFAASAACPECGAHPGTFKRFRPIYWIERFDAFEGLAFLSATPSKVAALVEASDGESAGSSGEGWSLHEAITHLKDAQEVLEFRVDLILNEENPILEAKAVFEWATADAIQAATTRDIFDAYVASRQRTLARLENLPVKDWWRTGRHEEFGELKLYQQVSYFACHELSHLAQIYRLAGVPAE